MTDDNKSLGDDATLGGENAEREIDAQSLGDQSTHGDHSQMDSVGDSSSLGDQLTFGGDGADGAPDDGMEIVDLESRYTIEGVLGKGGMGEVLLATDTRLERKVAIKRILGKASRSKTAVNRFLTEAKAVAALNHTNIVQIHDYGRDKQGPFLIMEYVAGQSLLERCQQGALALEEAIELTVQLCDGLAAAHDAHIVHRDVKPANILLTKNNIPKLTDFGLAKAETTDTGMTQAGAVLGTLDFMPPEQRKDAALVDPRSDLWSLAATLYQMVTGEPPRVIDLDAVPRELRNCLAQALKTNKDDRYQTAREFKDALRSSRSSTAEVELEEGDCPHCGTKNPTTRKFCRNHDCGESLEVPCLSCQTGIPMWEQVCDSCGAKQPDLVEQRRTQMASAQAEAESLLKGLDFDRAKRVAVTLRDEPDLRLMHLKDWAERLLAEIKTGREREVTRISELMTEAVKHQQAHDYTTGLRTLQAVRDIHQDVHIKGFSQSPRQLTESLQSCVDQIVALKTEINKKLNNRQLADIREPTNKLLALQPERLDLLKLLQKLDERDTRHAKRLNKVLRDAYTLRQRCEFAKAAEIILKIPAEYRSEEAHSSLNDCQSLASSRDRTMQLLKRSSETKEFTTALATAKTYRKALSDSGLTDTEFDRARSSCQQQLSAYRQSRRQKSLIIKLGIGAAAMLVVVVLVMVVLLAISDFRSVPIASALKRGDFATVLEMDPDNAKAQAMQNEAKKQADIQQALAAGNYQATLAIDPNHAAALAMQKKAKKQADIKQALAKGDYQAALNLDANNAAALAMKKMAHIKKALSDGDYEAVLSLDSGNVEALSMKKMANIEQALAKGDYQTVLELDANHEVALAMKKRADIEQALAKGDYQAVLGLDSKNAQAVAMKKQAELKQADAKMAKPTTLSGHTNNVFSVAFSPDGQTIASGSSDKTIKLWDAQSGKELDTLKGHKDHVLSVAFSPDGQTIASGSGDYSPNGQTFASGNDDNNIELRDTKSGRLLYTLTGHMGLVYIVAFSPDGQTIATGSSDKTIKLWDAQSGKELDTLKGHKDHVLSVAFSPDGQTIVSGSGDNTIKLWDVQSGKRLNTLSGHTADVNSVAFSPDGKRIASGSGDKTIKLWDVESGKELKTLTGHMDIVGSVAFSPDGRTIASSGLAHTIKLWNVESGKEIKTLNGHTDEVYSVAFSPDGQTIASASWDNTVKLWHVGDYLDALDRINEKQADSRENPATTTPTDTPKPDMSAAPKTSSNDRLVVLPKDSLRRPLSLALNRAGQKCGAFGWWPTSDEQAADIQQFVDQLVTARRAIMAEPDDKKEVPTLQKQLDYWREKFSAGFQPTDGLSEETKSQLNRRYENEMQNKPRIAGGGMGGGGMGGGGKIAAAAKFVAFGKVHLSAIVSPPVQIGKEPIGETITFQLAGTNQLILANADEDWPVLRPGTQCLILGELISGSILINDNGNGEKCDLAKVHFLIDLQPKKPSAPKRPAKNEPANPSEPPAKPSSNEPTNATGEKKANNDTENVAQFFGAKVSGTKFVFIIDCSGSMDEYGRWRRAVRELKSSITNLKQPQQFDVLLYNSSTVSMNNHDARLVTASGKNQATAINWLTKQNPFGNTYAANSLKTAFELRPDAIFLLSDGEFDDLALVKSLLQHYKGQMTPVHTISLGGKGGARTMKEIAEQNEGTYTMVKD